jgi:hypothetical protein
MALKSIRRKEARVSKLTFYKNLSLTILTVAVLSACSKSEPAPDQQPAQTPASQAVAIQSLPSNERVEPVPPPAVEVPVPQAPPPPTHIYGYEDNGQYGYEAALTDEDRKQGVSAKPLVMFRYLGMQGNRYLVEQVNGNVASRISCETPCEFVKVLTVNTYGGSKQEVLHLNVLSLMTGVFTDAINGQLVPTASHADYLFPVNWTVQRGAPPAAPAAQPMLAPTVVANDPTPAQLPTTSTPREATQLLPPDFPSSSPTVAPTVQTSFDCSKARSDAEHLICGDAELGALDVQLASVFARAKGAAKDPAAFKERTRLQWNYREQNCHDKVCLLRWYADQKTTLEGIAETGNL